MTKICIIPARGGSKRIPRKNIKLFHGKPIIAYSIETALNSKLFDSVIVSTDDNEIAEIARKYGAKVPFMRSDENSDDYSGTGDAVYEVLENLKKNGQVYDIGCCLYPTSPLTQISKLKEALELLNQNKFNVTFSVSKFNSTIWRSYKITNSKAEFNWPEYEKKRSQDISDAYFDTGQFYWFYPKVLKSLKNKNSFGTNKGVVIVKEQESQDIDNPIDWLLAESKYKLMHKK